ncbi:MULTISPECIES: NAD(P)H-dependent glycerol-3-phosphate dehydrogenase [Bacillaceae]|uniref:NAD(P)H-dependent glycerol-3-phosphate dehydrogenase n=1 Tax=Bacillaceae TaxID=186817 RepID=UPI001E56F437|nr:MULTISPECIES: NAD(P)H-dependent glycerol-3-phosphate dehydrogenase [Bacillaceae]MCE4047207.1 NAD(P)H-dependent glycerol-3-phosphate dehydrogenase [Bacillus sp. Au-Bac7]MCM3031353.1 NAD(P)H-dependent glycerol-3-phosphate dehydrogenase [Niallia sp. MER 6]MDL0435744.1 NAD(P)H-dependent glycerol-3-phosphate dehydrogenase [Niallia sp. SS-2023]UPO86426.1 NAD(P)H-dependent glycerol-3-phosphate dehydrogenase [Niallia sp. Man26]
MGNHKKIAMIGAGSWGTALALVLADNGHTVHLWGKNGQDIEEINKNHVNKRYLPDIKLSENIIGYTSMQESLKDVHYIVLSVPTKAMREVIQQIIPFLDEPKTFIHVSKGIEPGTLLRISEIMEEEIPERLLKSIVVLSGPSHAEEVSLRHLTTVTVSSKNMEEAEKVQDLFINSKFRVYTNPDIVGVEIGGALKNIIAVCAGITDGLGFGDNAKAALITRGLAEMARLGTKMGANPLTFSGLTGIGDLIVTCTSVHSRNWRAGNLLGKGCPLEEVLENMGMVVEGIRTTKAGQQLSEKYGIEMPITNALYDVLFNGKNAKEVVEGLMARDKTHEMEDLVNILASQYVE